MKIKCECGFIDDYEPDEFGLSYYQAVGKCPNCDKDLKTKENITFKIKELNK